LSLANPFALLRLRLTEGRPHTVGGEGPLCGEQSDALTGLVLAACREKTDVHLVPNSVTENASSTRQPASDKIIVSVTRLGCHRPATGHGWLLFLKSVRSLVSRCAYVLLSLLA